MSGNSGSAGVTPRVPVVILCGGLGSRIREVSETLPKPMNLIGGKPILWHIMKIYSAYGFHDFILCLGYKGWLIKEFFLNYRTMISDFTITLGRHGNLEFRDHLEEASWKATLTDTGEDTMTGGRLLKVKKYLEGCEHFFLTYGDGLADIDIGDLLRTHLESGLVGTITAVRVAGRFGELEIADGRVMQFSEKPALSSSRVSGGFMVFDSRRIWDYLDDREDLVLEEEPLARMVADRQLGVYGHDGFWQCMDTPREYNLLNTIWESGKPPWKVWD
ncbi:MAG: glucose-1-phosphate cytidylyltransferase [Candidatus Glassbacteria bacterium]|nr:glucose-1-phosphate cytidylyltransferase [Candidatus Glassbacteria bacterium]